MHSSLTKKNVKKYFDLNTRNTTAIISYSLPISQNVKNAETKVYPVKSFVEICLTYSFFSKIAKLFFSSCSNEGKSVLGRVAPKTAYPVKTATAKRKEDFSRSNYGEIIIRLERAAMRCSVEKSLPAIHG